MTVIVFNPSMKILTSCSNFKTELDSHQLLLFYFILAYFQQLLFFAARPTKALRDVVKNFGFFEYVQGIILAYFMELSQESHGVTNKHN